MPPAEDNILNFLIFLDIILGNHRAFVGSSQQSPVSLWRISQHTANSLPKRLWLACQRGCGSLANGDGAASCSYYHHPQPIKQLANVFIPVTRHEQHMHRLKLVLGVVPLKLRVPGPGKDEAVEDHGWILQTLLDVLDSFVEKDFLAGRPFVQHAVRLNEGNVLFSFNEHPQNEIRVEVTRLKKSHSFAPAHVPEQEQFHSILFKRGLVVVTPRLQIGDELIFTFVEGNRQDGNFPSTSDIKERLEEMLAEIAGVQIAAFQQLNHASAPTPS